MKQMIKPTFCFLDESGTLNINNPKVRYFAVGAIIHSFPDELIDKLHREFEGLCGSLKKEKSCLEFRFSNITKNSLVHYLNCLKILNQDKGWRFCSFVVNLDDANFNTPKDYLEAWECYLRYIKLLLQKNLLSNEKTTLVADYLRQPRRAPTHSLATMPSVVEQLWDVLQVESQGILLVQMTDVLLGGSLYNGDDECKSKVGQAVKKMRAQMGRKFNEWKVKWNN